MIIEYYPLLFIFLAWLVSFLATAMLLPMLKTFSVMDKPNERSNHKTVTPRGGGLAVVFSVTLLSVAYNIDINIIFAVLILATISFIDDLRDISIRWRLAAQVIAVIIAIPALHGRILPESIPAVIEWLLIGFFWIWFINLTNFMDGIDGITSMQVIMTATGTCLAIAANPSLPLWLASYCGIIAAATLGFFWFNRHPARLFMGDVGSIPLGFIMFFLLATLAINGGILPALILPAYYLCDATFTIIRRLLRGDKIWQAHSEHAYQKAVRRGMSHSEVMRKINMLNIFLILLAVFSTTGLATGIVMLVIAYATTAFMMRHLICGK